MSSSTAPTLDATSTPDPQDSPAAEAVPLDVAALYRVSLLADALRETARSLVGAGHLVAPGSMVARFNALRTTFGDLFHSEPGATCWLPNAATPQTSLVELFDAAAALASLVDASLHGPAVVLGHQMATSKVAAVQQLAAAGRGPFPGAVPAGGASTTDAPGAYL